MLVANKLILASESKYRRQILEQVGLKFETKPSKIDEYLIDDADGKTQASKRAAAKATKVANEYRNSIVIGCDQTLGFNGKIYDKALTAAEAAQRLAEFSGQTHQLYSAVSFMIHPEGVESGTLLDEFVETVPMTMRTLDSNEIDQYVSLGEWEGCVGCYQAENIGASLFSRIGGDLHTIIGLPTTSILSRLRKIGINPIVNREPPWELDRNL